MIQIQLHGWCSQSLVVMAIKYVGCVRVDFNWDAESSVYVYLLRVCAFHIYHHYISSFNV